MKIHDDSNQSNAEIEESEEQKDYKYIKKIDELELLLKETNELKEKYINQIKYIRADLENLQKNIERRIDEKVTKEKQVLIIQILVVAEEINLIVEEAKKRGKSNVLGSLEMIKKKIWNILNNEGLSPIDSIGHPFNPNLHEAVIEIETPDYPPGTVLEEVRKGYLFRGKLLKPSVVKVASIPRSNTLENRSK